MARKHDAGDAEPDKGELRRRQVLDAAAECFRKEGFHGSSIARISQAAGMSPGHIYHYFGSKEAIVEAIARREESELDELLGRMEDDRAGGDLATRITRQVPGVVDRFSDPAHVGLFLELYAEASRNRAVKRILQRTDETVMDELVDKAGKLGMPAGLDEAELRLRVQVLHALVNGLTIRGVVDPIQDRDGLIRLIIQLVHILLGEGR